MRHPLGTRTGSRLLHHLVDLLKRETLGLRDQEVGVDKGGCAESAPHEEDGGLEVAFVGVDLERLLAQSLGMDVEDEGERAYHVGGDDGDDGVPEPVGGGGESDTAGTDGQREDFTNDDPGTGTP